MAYKKWTASPSQLAPDPRYGSKLISKFINNLMWDGKKAVAQRVFYDAMDLIGQKLKQLGEKPRKGTEEDADEEPSADGEEPFSTPSQASL